MKTQVVQPIQSDAILHEQLALKRLKELHSKPPSSSLERGTPLALLLAIAKALFRRVELHREVAPGQPPVRWHEAERARDLRALQLM